MNRLSPLIVRRAGALAPPLDLDWHALSPEAHSELLDDLRMFVTGWLGGLIFFGTFLA